MTIYGDDYENEWFKKEEFYPYMSFIPVLCFGVMFYTHASEQGSYRNILPKWGRRNVDVHRGRVVI